MNRSRGFFMFDLTLAIVLLLAVASVFVHVVWLYNRDCGRLAAMRSAARNEQTILYRAVMRPQEAAAKQWITGPGVIRLAKMSSRGGQALPGGSHWVAIHGAGHSAGQTLYALALAPRTKRTGGKK